MWEYEMNSRRFFVINSHEYENSLQFRRKVFQNLISERENSRHSFIQDETLRWMTNQVDILHKTTPWTLTSIITDWHNFYLQTLFNEIINNAKPLTLQRNSRRLINNKKLNASRQFERLVETKNLLLSFWFLYNFWATRWEMDWARWVRRFLILMNFLPYHFEEMLSSQLFSGSSDRNSC